MPQTSNKSKNTVKKNPAVRKTAVNTSARTASSSGPGRQAGARASSGPGKQRSSKVSAQGSARNRAAGGSSGRQAGSTASRPSMSERKELRDPEAASEVGKDIAVLISFAVSVLLFMSNFGLAGKLGSTVSRLQFGLAGRFAYIMPFLFFFAAVYIIANVPWRIAGAVIRVFIAAVAFSCLCGLAQLLTGKLLETASVADYFAQGRDAAVGGAAGGLLLSMLLPALGSLGAGVVLASILIVCVVALTGMSVLRPIKQRGAVAAASVRLNHEKKRERKAYDKLRRSAELADEYEKAHENRAQMEQELDDLADALVRGDKNIVVSPMITRIADFDIHIDEKGLRNGKKRPAKAAKRKKELKTDAPVFETSFPEASFSDASGAASASEASASKASATAASTAAASAAAASTKAASAAAPSTKAASAAAASAAAASAKAASASGMAFKEKAFPEISGAEPDDDDIIDIDMAGRVKTATGSKLQAGGRTASGSRYPAADGHKADVSGQGVADDRASYSDEDFEDIAIDFEMDDVPGQAFHFDEPAYTADAMSSGRNISKGNVPAGRKLSSEKNMVSDKTVSSGKSMASAKNVSSGTVKDTGSIWRTGDSGDGNSGMTFRGGSERSVGAGDWSSSSGNSGDYYEEGMSGGAAYGRAGRTTAVKPSLQRSHPAKPASRPSAGAAAEADAEKDFVMPKELPERPYKIPPVSLLHSGPKAARAKESELRATAIKLQQTLASYGVGVTVTNVSCGPTVTRFELKPDQGVRVNQVLSRVDDIQLNLAASEIRIEAPIPGKSAIGIEVPNSENETVYFKELVESQEFKRATSKVCFAVGRDISGRVIIADIDRMPHLLIAGATGSGKSVCINTIIMSVLYKARPDEVRMIMIDPKVVELSVYNGIPHLMIPVVTDPKKAAGALQWAVTEMANRYKTFAKHNVRDIVSYNRLLSAPDHEEGMEFMPRILIIVDELADLMMVSPKEVEGCIQRLAQLARAAGLHLILATQRPSVNVITGVIKANVPSRLAFAVSSSVDSRTILDMGGAEKLLGKGDMLFHLAGWPKPVRIQGAFVSDTEILSVVDFLKAQSGKNGEEEAESSRSLISQIESGAAANDEPESEQRDELFERSGRFLIEKGKGTSNILQRTFRIGFNRAARILDQLTEAGVLGPDEGTKPRQVLMTMEEFEEMLERGL